MKLRNLLFILTCLFFALAVTAGCNHFLQLRQRLEMRRAAENFHRACVKNDVRTMDGLLSDDFVESGVNHSVSGPESLNKDQIIGFCGNLDDQFSIEIGYFDLLNILNFSRDRVYFVREGYFQGVRDVSYFLSYEFTNKDGKLLIRKAVRHY